MFSRSCRIIFAMRSQYTSAIPAWLRCKRSFQRPSRSSCVKNHVQEIIACGREYRCFEDFDYRDSQQKKAFYRRWYHMRTQHPQISLEGYQEDYEAKHNGEAWDVPDEGAQTERTVLGQVNVEQFLKTLSEKDQQILELRMREYSLDEIAKKLGYQNHSGVLKRIKKIGLAYEAWSGKDLGF